jgi:hypothetical protein
VRAQEVKWNKAGTTRARNFTFSHGKGNENCKSRKVLFVQQRKTAPVNLLLIGCGT